MRIRALPVVIKAVQDGVQAGLMLALEEGKKPENEGNPDILKDVVAATVVQYLVHVIDFGSDLEMFASTEQPQQQ